MKSLKFLCPSLIFFLLIEAPLLSAATEAQAEAITAGFDKAHTQWLVEMKLAKKVGNTQQVVMMKPNAAEYAQRLKVLISRDLAKPWTLKYGAWLLENDPSLKPSAQRALLGSVEKHHITSPRIGRFCVSMIYLNQRGELPRPGQPSIRSRGMQLLKTIRQTNPEAKVQGQAALALSMLLAGLGDDARVMKERIGYLREAIVKSADVRVGDLTVAKIAEDELYKINHLTKGREAPDLVGRDSAGSSISLKSYRGKVVMLVFWSSWDNEASRLLGLLRKRVETNAGKPFAVVGVNRDSLTNLRLLEADQIVTWRNFSDPKHDLAKVYRVAAWPYCLVLDKSGVIRYRGSFGSFADAVAEQCMVDTSGLPAGAQGGAVPGVRR